MSDVKSTIYQRCDGQMIVTTGPTTCCFGSKRSAAEFIAMYQEELLLTKERLAAAEAELRSTVADLKTAHDDKSIAETAAFFLLEVVKHTDPV